MTPEMLQYLAADLEYDSLREEGYWSPGQKEIVEEMERKEKEKYEDGQ